MSDDKILMYSLENEKKNILQETIQKAEIKELGLLPEQTQKTVSKSIIYKDYHLPNKFNLNPCQEGCSYGSSLITYNKKVNSQEKKKITNRLNMLTREYYTLSKDEKNNLTPILKFRYRDFLKGNKVPSYFKR